METRLRRAGPVDLLVQQRPQPRPEGLWDRLCRQVAAEAGNRCEICGGRRRRWPVECHEVWHYDDDRKIQRLERLAALCPGCHEVKEAVWHRNGDASRRSSPA